MQKHTLFTSLADSLKITRKKAEPKKKKELGCETCGLDKGCKTPIMQGTGNKNAKIMIVGEFPENLDDLKGIPFIGKTGRLLRNVLIQKGIDPETDCFITNSCRCHPIDNETPTSKQILSCFKRLEEEILEMQPEIILLAGGVALEALLGTDAITKYRGFTIPYAKYKTILLPTFHPSFISRNLDLNIMCLEEDIKKLKSYKKFNEYDLNQYEDNHTILKTTDEIENLLIMVQQVNKFAIDFETMGGLKPYNKNSRLLICSIAFEPDKSYSFDITPETLPFIKEFFQVPGVIKIMHNHKFELIWGYEKANTGWFNLEEVHDTMLFSYLLREVKGTHSLDFQSFVRLGLNKLEGVDQYKQDMSKCPYELLHKYGGVDVKLTYRLDDVLFPQVRKEPKLLNVYNELLLKGSKAVLASEMEGAVVDWSKVGEINAIYKEKISKVIIKLYSLPVVKTFKEKNEGKFNLRSPKDISSFMKINYGEDSMKRTDKGNYSIDAGVLKVLADKGDEFCTLLLQYRDLGKVMSTYMEGEDKEKISGLKKFVYDDGLIHTDYNLHIAETGRLSSSNMNLQNVDKRKHKEIRTFFTAPKNHVLMSLDYCGAEITGAAFVSQDKNLSKKLTDKVDIHGEWVEKIFKVHKGEKTFKEIRDNLKGKFTFQLIYGGSYKSIAADLNISESNSKMYCDEFYHMYEGIWNYHKKVIRFYKQHGYVETLFGRRRRAPLSYNEIINSPIQSLMSDFTLKSMIKATDRGFHVPLMIHDDLTLYVPENKIKETFEEMRDIMTNYDYDFINAPLEVECKIGENWGQMFEIESIL